MEDGATALSSCKDSKHPQSASATSTTCICQLYTFQRSVESFEGKEQVVLAVGVQEVMPGSDEPCARFSSQSNVNKFQPLISDPDWYLECFNEFVRRNNDRHDVIDSWIKYNLRSMVGTQLDDRRELLHSPPSPADQVISAEINKYNILSIGSGSGKFMTAYLFT